MLIKVANPNREEKTALPCHHCAIKPRTEARNLPVHLRPL